LSFWYIVIGANVLYAFVPPIIRKLFGSYWHFLDCRWAIRNIPRGGRAVEEDVATSLSRSAGPPSTWPEKYKREAYWPKKYGGPWV
jgi:hypothetical protein